MVSIAELLKRDQVLEAVSDTPRLDTEVLLSYVLGKTRSYLYAWPETKLGSQQLCDFELLLARRSGGEPVAHLTGEKEFWSLPLEVNPSTLIPRPETELLVEIAIELSNKPDACALDLGTGTGAIALALASERPGWNVFAVDRSQEAVELAKKNRDRLGLYRVNIVQSNWFSNIETNKKFDLIVSNPPYIAPGDRHLEQGDVRFEPRSALVADNSGFADLQIIIERAPAYLVAGGFLLIEHGCTQGEQVRQLLSAEFDEVTTWRDVAGVDRVSGGRLG